MKLHNGNPGACCRWADIVCFVGDVLVILRLPLSLLTLRDVQKMRSSVEEVVEFACIGISDLHNLP